MVGILAPLRHQLAAELANASSEGQAREAIERTFGQMVDDDGIADAIWRANLKSHLGGQLFIRDVEIKQATRQLAGTPPPTFLNLAFTEAIEHFAARAILSPEEFAVLQDAERFRSFTMTRAISTALMTQAKSLLDSAMQPSGVGLRDFILGVEQDEVALGFTPNSHAYLENVYRTSTATSYNAGRFQQQTDPDVIASTGYWKYITAGDNRVRSSHAALDGKMWEIGDPEALSVYPPNGYQCRCCVVVVDREDVDEAALNRPIDAGEAIQEGFSGSPGQTIEAEANA